MKAKPWIFQRKRYHPRQDGAVLVEKPFTWEKVPDLPAFPRRVDAERWYCEVMGELRKGGDYSDSFVRRFSKPVLRNTGYRIVKEV